MCHWRCLALWLAGSEQRLRLLWLMWFFWLCCSWILTKFWSIRIDSLVWKVLVRLVKSFKHKWWRISDVKIILILFIIYAHFLDLPTYLIIVACVLLATAAFHVILIFGIKFRKSFAIVPYILLLIGLISFVVSICNIHNWMWCAEKKKFSSYAFQSLYQNCVVYGSYESTWQENSADDKIKLITVYVFAVLLSIYLILCMYSLYKTIKFEENRRKNYILPNWLS